MKKTSLKRRTPLRTKKTFKPKGSTSIERMLGEGLIKKASTLKRKPMRKIAKTQKGWWDVALEVWDERPHNCEVCSVPLGDECAPIFMSHLLPRGSYRKYKRDHRNIRVQCPECHSRWHKYGPEALQWSFRWRSTCDLYFQLRNEANGVQ